MEYYLLLLCNFLLSFGFGSGQTVLNLEMEILSQSEVQIVEGSNVTLSCRFHPKNMEIHNRLYWIRYDNDMADEIAIDGEKRKRNTRVHLDRAAGIYDLSIRAANFTFHNGLYQCVLVDLKKLIEFTRYVNLNILAIPNPPKISPGQLRLNGGDTTPINCAAARIFPGCEIIWFKKKGSVTNYVESFTNDSTCESSIILKVYNADHGQELVCKILNKRLDSQYSNQGSILMEINHKPGNPIITPTNATGFIGQKMDFKCSSDVLGFPLGVFRWKQRKGQSEDFLSMGPLLSFTLEIGVNEILCEIKNEFGTSTSSVAVKVILRPQIDSRPKHFIELPVDTKNFSLIVFGSAFPKAEMVWTKDTIPVPAAEGSITVDTSTHMDEQGIFQTKTVLTFVKPSGLLSGVYKCSFTNDYGLVTSTTTIKIKDVPHFLNERQDEEILASLGGKVVLTCLAYGDPAPHLKWITPPASYNVRVSKSSANQQTSWLTIGQVKEADFAEYTCEAWNEFGASQLKFWVSPHLTNPINVRISNSTFNSLTIQWDEDFDLDLNATEGVESSGHGVDGDDEDENDQRGSLGSTHSFQYKIRYHIPNQGKTQQDFLEKDCGAQDSCQIQNLLPGTLYIMKVIPYYSTWHGSGTALSAWTEPADVKDKDTSELELELEVELEREMEVKESGSTIWILFFGAIVLISLFLIGITLYYQVKRSLLMVLPGAKISSSKIQKLKGQWQQRQRRGNKNQNDPREIGDNFSSIREKEKDQQRDDEGDRRQEIIQRLENPCSSATAIKLFSQITSVSLENDMSSTTSITTVV